MQQILLLKTWSKSLVFFILEKNKRQVEERKATKVDNKLGLKGSSVTAEAESPRRAYHFTLQSRSSSIAPGKPSVKKHA